MALTKDDIIEALVTKNNLQRREAADFFDTFIDNIKKTVERGERAKLVGFGAFYLKKQYYHRKRRDIPVDADTADWRTVTLFPAKKLRDRIQYAGVMVSRDVD